MNKHQSSNHRGDKSQQSCKNNQGVSASQKNSKRRAAGWAQNNSGRIQTVIVQHPEPELC